jgi:hypothetical protein
MYPDIESELRVARHFFSPRRRYRRMAAALRHSVGSSRSAILSTPRNGAGASDYCFRSSAIALSITSAANS